jgi:hypothetical protein
MNIRGSAARFQNIIRKLGKVGKSIGIDDVALLKKELDDDDCTTFRLDHH